MDQEFYKKLLDSITDGVYFVDPDRKVTYWNKAAERISGYSAQEILGHGCGENILRHVDDSGNHLCLHGCPLAATMQDGKRREANVYLHHKSGHRVPVIVRTLPMRDASGNITGAAEVFVSNRSIDMLGEIEQLRKEALTDPLTGIGNRRYADITLERLDQSMREGSVPFGVLFIDIDNFKHINDTWGHHVGDRVLTIVAKTLTAALRPFDVTCRWGGEEFVVLINNTTVEGLKTLAERLRMLVEQSWMNHEDGRIQMTASIGAALSGMGEPAISVVQRADRQLYLCKNSGRNCIHMNGKKVKAGK